MDGVVYTNLNQRAVSGVIRSLVRGRYLLLELILKDLRARYRNTIMGILWAVLQPLLMMLILYFVMDRVFQMKLRPMAGGDAPSFSLFLLCGLVAWQYTAGSLIRATASLIEHHELIKKVNFPRETIPLAAIGQAVVNAAIGMAVFFVFYAAQRHMPSVSFLWVPVIFAIQTVLIVGLALLLSALNVMYRDVAYMLEVALMLGFYATPIFYDANDVMAGYSGNAWITTLYQANPMVGLVSSYREALLYHHMPAPMHLAWPALVGLAALLAGVVVFRRSAPTFADYV